jgi:PPOX class probable F420-dependent enzyme
MASLNDPSVKALLEQPNYAVITTTNRDGTLHSTVVWINLDGDRAAVNSAIGRLWPTNLQRDPRIAVLVYESGNPYHFVEIRGTANGTTDGALEHINALAKKYIGQDQYPYLRPGEQRIKFVIQPTHVRYVKQR